MASLIERSRRVPQYALATRLLAKAGVSDFWRVWRPAQKRVRGWLRTPDAMLLYHLARHGEGSGSVVEIGSAWGRSTICLAAGCRDAGRGRVTAIDPHTGDAWFLEEEGVGQIDSFAEFSNNIAAAGLGDWVDPVVSTSDDAALAPPMPIRLLFIDGSHAFDDVTRDIANWVPRVIPGGTVVFDDYDNDAPGVGVHAAVDDLLASGLVEPQLHRGFNLVWTRTTG